MNQDMRVSIKRLNCHTCFEETEKEKISYKVEMMRQEFLIPPILLIERY